MQSTYARTIKFFDTIKRCHSDNNDDIKNYLSRIIPGESENVGRLADCDAALSHPIDVN